MSGSWWGPESLSYLSSGLGDPLGSLVEFGPKSSCWQANPSSQFLV